MHVRFAIVIGIMISEVHLAGPQQSNELEHKTIRFEDHTMISRIEDSAYLSAFLNIPMRC